MSSCIKTVKLFYFKRILFIEDVYVNLFQPSKTCTYELLVFSMHSQRDARLSPTAYSILNIKNVYA